MPTFDASGTVLGSSAASAASATRIIRGATFPGASSFVAQGASNQLSSAFFQGASACNWDWFIDAAAAFSGGSLASANAHNALGASGVFVGSSLFLYGTLFPIQGASYFSVVSFVEHQLPPIKAITMGPKRFRWLQTLQRGDLPVFICDGRSPVVPFRIAYNLIQLRLNGTRKYVGPQQRSPVSGSVGEFYATGRAGESGQPGQWIIEWVFQRTHESAVLKTEMRFQVCDAVAVGNPREPLDRKIKFGWS